MHTDTLNTESLAALSDIEVLRRVIEDKDAIGVLYDRHARTLFFVALRVLKDRTEAEDVLHDAFVAVSQRADQYVPERGTVVAWLAVVVRNLSIDRARRRVRRSELVQSSAEPPPSIRDPERLAVEHNAHTNLRRTMGTLPPDHLRLLEGVYFHGIGYAELAERENLPVGTVKSRVARALVVLRETMQRQARRAA